MDITLLQNTHRELNIDWVEHIASTQSAVKNNGLLIAENQPAGVGRRGNHWLTVPGKSICFSLRLNLTSSVAGLSGYALIIGVAVIETLLFFDTHTQARLKWPNDLYVNDKKFGGILINLTPKTSNTTDVTIGIGINWTLSDEQLASINQPVTNIPLSIKPKRAIFINQLVAQIKNNNQRFLADTLSSILPIWQQYDYLIGRHIMIKQNEQMLHGKYCGINPCGQLQAIIDNQLKTFSAAEVSIRNHV
ncbi:MAG: biotin--[acetyl-CoA-carboxylase] ligase [Marinicella sp.]|nr:biotin--[acetyl-CoA-carboxylase] ligase [Xanthomonadales bacterium]